MNTPCYNGNGFKWDLPYLVHPTRADRLRKFTLAEGRRLMGASADLALPPGTTRPWELLGQAVYVPLVTEIVRHATGRAAWNDAEVVGREAATFSVADNVPVGVTASADAWADLPLFGG